ncbi:DNA/RNA helicase domain-containing protein [Ligilactobacillus sp. LYQ139]|uniref:DNA/RNA helicase domain-containing protein n=1 Tax=Ligilactobacillus sp. LYQ139 TaxID=3378800 RepID=UPI003853AA68
MKSITLNEYLSLAGRNLLRQAEENYFHCNQKDVEIKTTITLFRLLKERIGMYNDITGFFFDTDINIVSDFDILRFTKSSIINIELKSSLRDQNVYKEVERKFRNQNRILRIVRPQEEQIHDVLFLIKNEKCDFYTHDVLSDSLKLIDIEEFIGYLELGSPDNAISENLVENLRPSDYLIDPIKKTDDFINDNYYLTQQQVQVKDDILHNRHKGNILGVKGNAGTGKTLVALDTAKSLSREGKNVLFIFSGTMKDGHKTLNSRLDNVTFIQAKSIYDTYLSAYDYIIVDEAQRLYLDQARMIGTFATNNPDKKIIMFYDQNQSLSKKDGLYFINNLCDYKVSLSKKIRSNLYITYFIDKIMYKVGVNKPAQIDLGKLSNYVTVRFFNSSRDAKPWIKEKIEEGFIFIKPSGDRLNKVSADSYLDIPFFQDTHGVIGNQFSNVVTYIDEGLIYKKDDTNPHRPIKLTKVSNDYYFLENEFYVNCSRATDNLALAIVNNEEIYKHIISSVFNFDANK